MKKALALILSVIMAFSFVGYAAATDEKKPFDNSSFYTNGEYTLHYRTYNPEKTPEGQIMLIHGFCLSTASLEGIAEEYMKAGYKVVTVDAPNFGYSTREAQVERLLDREYVIYSLVEHLGGEWIIGGHSMGGGIALNLATIYPQRFRGLVLFAPQTNAEMNGAAKVMASSGFMQSLYTFILKIALLFPGVVRKLVETSFSDSEYAKEYDISRITKPLSLKQTGAGIAIMASHTMSTDFEKVAALSLPVVVIIAEQDKVASKENLEQIIAALGDNAVVYEVEKGGHMMMEYNPALVCEKTLPTIEKCW